MTVLDFPKRVFLSESSFLSSVGAGFFYKDPLFKGSFPQVIAVTAHFGQAVGTGGISLTRHDAIERRWPYLRAESLIYNESPSGGEFCLKGKIFSTNFHAWDAVGDAFSLSKDGIPCTTGVIKEFHLIDGQKIGRLGTEKSAVQYVPLP